MIITQKVIKFAILINIYSNRYTLCKVLEKKTMDFKTIRVNYYIELNLSLGIIKFNQRNCSLGLRVMGKFTGF